ncbi:MAG: DUF3108 domain-containing protein [Bacteroidota bacterium]|nr:MAG: DUF3108 domain-containing protein [Bacteroidota bacterium]
MVFCSSPSQDKAQFPIVKNNAFKRGEKLTYRIHYGFIDAVVATIEILPEVKKFGDRNTMHIVGIGKSKGTFDFFLKFVTGMKPIWMMRP